MGRLMMSYVLDESSTDAELTKTPVPVIQTECTGPELPHYENWSASNAFDPDSEEFWQAQNVVYEAFVDDLSCPELSPSSSEASSDTDGIAILQNRRLAHRERRRRAEDEQPAALEGYVASDGRLRMRHIRPLGATLRQMAIIATSTTVTDSPTSGETVATAPIIIERPDRSVASSPVRIPFDDNDLNDINNIDDEQLLVPIRSVTPPARSSFAEMWSDLRSITHSPMPFVSQTSLDAVSPPPSVTPHIYTWDRATHTPTVGSPTSPTPIRARMSTGGRPPRRSLPPSISLMT